MTKEEIYQEVRELLFGKNSSNLSKDEYKELLQDIESECNDMLQALELDE